MFLVKRATNSRAKLESSTKLQGQTLLLSPASLFTTQQIEYWRLPKGATITLATSQELKY